MPGSWTVDWSPRGMIGDYWLNAISVSPDEVWAVGNASGPGMIARRSAIGWSFSPFPPSLLNIQLKGVVALPSKDAWAVGWAPSLLGDKSLFAHGHHDSTGFTWTEERWNPPGPSEHQLYAIDGQSEKDLWAVGRFRRGSGDWKPLALRLKGNIWIADRSPAMELEGGLWSVTVVDVHDAWALGYRILGIPPGQVPLIARWNGESWQPQRFPLLRYESSVLWSVSASAKDDAWAVGEEAYPNGQTLTLHWDGSNWTQVPTAPTPGRSFLQGVSCVTSTDCWAVGTEVHNNEQRTLVLHWDGTNWVREVTPNPFPRQLLTCVSVQPGGRVWAGGLSLVPPFGAWEEPLVLTRP